MLSFKLHLRKWKASHVYVFLLFGMLLYSGYLVILSTIKTPQFRQLYNPGSDRKIQQPLNTLPNRGSPPSTEDVNIPTCYYDSSLVGKNAIDKEWHTALLSCEGLPAIFYSDKGSIFIDQTLLAEQEMSLQSCTFKTMEWDTDDSYKFRHFDENSLDFPAPLTSDFFYIKCIVELKKNPKEDPINETIEADENIRSNINNDYYNPGFGSSHHIVTSPPKDKTSLKESIGKRRPNKNNLKPSRRDTFLNYEQFFVHVVEKDDTIEKVRPLLERERSESANVLILVIESISQKTFLENFSHTSILFESLDSIILHGFNAMGDSGIATLLPLLTGMTDDELSDLKKRGSGGQFIGALPFIWNKFEELGYVTLFAEDQPETGTFQNHFMGFEEPPVDHYMRPFWLAAESALFSHANVHDDCLGSKPKHRYILEYLTSFFDRYENIPKFALGVISDSDQIRRLDGDLSSFYDSLRAEGILKKTLTILIGDHGASHGDSRTTFGGMLNERLPLALFSLPDAIKHGRPNAVESMKINRHRLTNALDIHSTLLRLVDPSVDTETRGFSLFDEIPVGRSCQSASISAHYCTCSKYGPDIDVRDSVVASGAERILERINQILHEANSLGGCQELALDGIISARLVIPNDLAYASMMEPNKEFLLTNLTSEHRIPEKFFIQIVFQTSPGGALFEGTISLLDESLGHPNPPIINPGDISRINRYGPQSRCIEKIIPSISRFCICSEQ